MMTLQEQLDHAIKVNRIVHSDMEENEQRMVLYTMGYNPYNVDKVMKPDWAGRKGILVEPIKNRIRTKYKRDSKKKHTTQ